MFILEVKNNFGIVTSTYVVETIHMFMFSNWQHNGRTPTTDYDGSIAYVSLSVNLPAAI